MAKNTFLYKGDKAELHEESDVEALLADGWFDNPTDALAAGEEVPGDPDAEETERGSFDGVLDGTAKEIAEAVADFDTAQIQALIEAEEAGNTRHNVMDVLHTAYAIADAPAEATEETGTDGAE